MKETDKEKWTPIRRRGPLRFIMINGFIEFGIATTILAFFIDRVFEHKLDFSNYFELGWQRDVLEAYIQWSITGIIWGVLMWFFFVKRIKLVEKEKDN